jgi:hypothetical protein
MRIGNSRSYLIIYLNRLVPHCPDVASESASVTVPETITAAREALHTQSARAPGAAVLHRPDKYAAGDAEKDRC